MMGRWAGTSHCQGRRGGREALSSIFWATLEYSLVSEHRNLKFIVVIIDIVIKAPAACCKVLCLSCFSTTPLLKPFSLAFVDVIYHLQLQCNR